MSSESAYFPLVSVIIPVLNAESTLSLCLESIQNLDYPKDRVELIVVDNGSDDESIEIARKFGAKLLNETLIKSSYAARNKGIKNAQGELIAFTDADCIVTPGWLKYLVTDWDDETIGCFAGEIEAYQPKRLVEKYSDRAGILRQQGTLLCQYLPYAQTANAAYRREVFDKIGLFIPEMVSGGDADIAWRMQQKLGLKIKFVPEALVYHKHRSNIESLYGQFKNYEHGKLHWKKYYPDYSLPTVEQRQEELTNAIKTITERMHGNVLQLREGMIDDVDFVSPFLRMVICWGTYADRTESPFDYFTSLSLADVDELFGTGKSQLAEKDRELSERDSQLAEKDNQLAERDNLLAARNHELAEKDIRIRDLLNSYSWRLTAPFRAAYDLIKVNKRP